MLTTPGHEKPPGAATLHARPRALSNDRARAVPTKRRKRMSFSDHKITSFTHKIADLPDQPNLPADELKARFDSSPEELRVAHNALCDDSARLDTRVSGIVTQTFGDAIPKSMLSDELAAELDAKATQTALAEEAQARTDLSARVTTTESTLSAHATQIAQKCQIYAGTYTGNGAATHSVNLGFQPKAVFVVCEGHEFDISLATAALAVAGVPVQVEDKNYIMQTLLQVTSTGFTAGQGGNRSLNNNHSTYFYMAFQ